MNRLTLIYISERIRIISSSINFENKENRVLQSKTCLTSSTKGQLINANEMTQTAKNCRLNEKRSNIC